MQAVTYTQYGHIAMINIHGKPFLVAEQVPAHGYAKEYWRVYFTIGNDFGYGMGETGETLDALVAHIESSIYRRNPKLLEPNAEHQPS